MVVAYTNFPNEMATIPLDEIISDATIRFTIIDGVQYLSIRDLIMHVCCKNDKRAAETWDRLNETNKNDFDDVIKKFKFHGRGQQEQPVITFPGAVELIWILPGENAKKNRSAMSKIVIRYFAGDPSLIREIEHNAESNEPLAQMARASLVSEKKGSPLHVSRKREYEELEYEERVLFVERKRVEIQKMKADAEKTQADAEKTKADAEKIRADAGKTKVDTNAKNIELYASLCGPHPRIDDRARLLFKDVVMNIATGPVAGTPGQLQITPSGEIPVKEQSTGFLTISTVASYIGYTFDTNQLMKVGVAVKKAYKTKYGEEPPKHEQFVGGAVRRVNTYQEKDRELMEFEIQEFAMHIGMAG